MMVCTAENVKKIEDTAAEKGMSYFSMMENAGYAVADEILKRKDVKGKNIAVICGGGNNGGDGFVVARLLEEKGAICNVAVIFDTVSDTAKFAKKLYNGNYSQDVFEAILNADIIVDALFGTGLKRKLEGKCLEIVNAVNKSNAYTVSVDLPSGLFADKGEETPCVKADLTVTFIAYKLCHLMFPARSFCGETVICDIGISSDITDDTEYVGKIINPPVFKKRESNTHKGTYGTASLVVGSFGMAGAAILSLKGALLSGVGIAKATVPRSIYPMVTVSAPEAVCNVYDDTDDIEAVCEEAMNANALVIGCGLSTGEKAKQMLSFIIENYNKKLIIDADGINILAENIECIKHSSADIVLTPHPAEMARLLKTDTKEIERDRIFYARKLAENYSVTVVLKGAVTIVCNKHGQVNFNVTGNPSMAKGGSGDTLSGIIVSLAAQGMSGEQAAICGVCIHGLAGDMARDEKGEISALPSDIIDNLPQVFKKLGE